MTKSVIIDGIEYVPKGKREPLSITSVTIEYENSYIGLGLPTVRTAVDCKLVIADLNGNKYLIPVTEQLAKLLIEAVHDHE